MAMSADSTLTQAKYNAFLGTIAMCIIYAVIALVLLLVGSFTQFGRTVIFGDFKTFTQTYIFATILVIIIITVYVNDWNGQMTAQAVNTSVIDPMSCPDYWKLDKLDTQKIANLRNSLTSSKDLLTSTTTVNGVSTTTDTSFKTEYYDKNLSDGLVHNVCKMDPLIFDTKNFQFSSTQSNVQNVLSDTFNNQFTNTTLRNNMMMMSANEEDGTPLITETTDASGNKTYTTTLKCNKVYPELMAKIDSDMYAANNFQGPSNTFRCEYAKACGVPWTTAGCSKN